MAQRFASVHIPTPCPESWDAMTPTDVGRHCAACAKTVVGFTPMSQDKILAYLAAHKGQQASAAIITPAVLQHHKRPCGPHYWLLAVAVFIGWQSALAQSAVRPPAQQEVITIRGVVLDDSLNVPIPGLWLYLNDSTYGAVTDERGEFTISFPAAWKPVRGGVFKLQAWPLPYTFKPTQVRLDVRNYDQTLPLTLRLASAPGRGRNNLKGVTVRPRPVSPPVYPARSRTARR